MAICHRFATTGLGNFRFVLSWCRSGAKSLFFSWCYSYTLFWNVVTLFLASETFHIRLSSTLQPSEVLNFSIHGYLALRVSSGIKVVPVQRVGRGLEAISRKSMGRDTWLGRVRKYPRTGVSSHVVSCRKQLGSRCWHSIRAKHL